MPGHFTQTLATYDESLLKADSRNYFLSIQLSLDGFSFCIFSKTQNKFLSMESMAAQNIKNTDEFCSLFEDTFHQHEWLNLSYHNTIVLFETSKSTMIPVSLFEEKEKENYARLNFTVATDQQINTDKLANVDAVKLSLVPKQIVTLFNRLFQGYRLVSHASALIEGILILGKNLPVHQRCYVNVRNSFIDIVITEGRKLLYYNTFGYKTKEDFIYYLVFVLEQMKLNPEEIEVVFSGLIDRNSKLFEMVYKYIRNTSFASLTDSFNYSYIFNDIPKHYYFNLMNFYLCEL